MIINDISNNDVTVFVNLNQLSLFCNDILYKTYIIDDKLYALL